MPSDPYIKLNIDGSAIGNPRIVGAGRILWDNLGGWISGFSLNLGLASNNMVELAAIWHGLEMAWNMGFKFKRLELDSSVALSWLTNKNTSYPTNMMPLICDCRSLMG